MKRKICTLLFVLTISSPVLAEETFNCYGNLRVFGFDGRSLVLINSNSKENFHIDRKKSLSFSIALDGLNSIAKVFPWNGIHFKKLPYAEKNGINVTLSSDKENWFEVKASKGNRSKELFCQFQEF